MVRLLFVLIFSLSQVATAARQTWPVDSHANGFENIDVVGQRLARERQIEVYQGLFDFRAVQKDADRATPWLAYSVAQPEAAWALALAAQKYVYEGWFNTADSVNNDTHFRSNNVRQWCSTPWLNVGAKGREAFHGLTKEFPIDTSDVYPDLPVPAKKTERQTSWGIAYFNSPGCDAYAEVFGTPQEPKSPPQWTASRYGDGFVSFKLLFSTLDGWENYVPWQGAYAWTAHISQLMEPFKKTPEALAAANGRRVKTVPHIQMDIAIKDSRLQGLADPNQPWVMLTYYFDPTYDNQGLGLPFLPQGFKHMRPQGVQWGYDAGHSLIFDGAYNNHVGVATTHNERRAGGAADYPVTRLNGPADNPRSSCLGCHGVSGHQEGLSKTIPGISSNAEYFQNIVPRPNFDLNMQVNAAYKNFEVSTAPPPQSRGAPPAQPGKP